METNTLFVTNALFYISCGGQYLSLILLIDVFKICMRECIYMYIDVCVQLYLIKLIYDCTYLLFRKTELSRDYTSESDILISEIQSRFLRPCMSVVLSGKMNSSLHLWLSHNFSPSTVRKDGSHKAITSTTSKKE